MSRFRRVVAIVLLLLSPLLAAAPRRRAAAAPGGPGDPAVWLGARAHPIDDLSPLRTIVSQSSIVALGDATHGTHEFFAIRLRVLDFLVCEMGFDVLSIEAPFPIMERINTWAQGGGGSVYALLAELDDRLNYFFWNTEELAAVLEWVRDTNAHRGDRPPIEIAGADIYDQDGGVAGVLAWLRSVDPAAATQAENDYRCVSLKQRTAGCRANAQRVYDGLTARSEPRTRDYEDALHHAEIVLQYFDGQRYEPRDANMAENLLWIRDHRGSARKVVHWGHQEHIGRIESDWVRGRSMGQILAESLGNEYVAIGTLAGSGRFWQWQSNGSDYLPVMSEFPDPAPDSYESIFRAHTAAAFLLPLRGYVPRWLAGPRTFRTAGTTPEWRTMTEPLPQKLDAVFYFDRTTATRLLR